MRLVTHSGPEREIEPQVARARRFVDALAPEDWARLRRDAVRAVLPAGGVLLREGDHAGVALILAGRVKTTRRQGARQVVIDVHGAGELVPDLGALHGWPSAVSVHALERLDALLVPPLAFATFLEGRRRAGFAALRTQTEALRTAFAWHAEVSSASTLARLAGRLDDLARRYGTTTGSVTSIDLPLTQDELAGWIGASHKATATALARLRADGCIDTRRRAIVIHDRAALQELAAGDRGRRIG